jgi:hypothetical protein
LDILQDGALGVGSVKSEVADFGTWKNLFTKAHEASAGIRERVVADDAEIASRAKEKEAERARLKAEKKKADAAAAKVVKESTIPTAAESSGGVTYGAPQETTVQTENGPITKTVRPIFMDGKRTGFQPLGSSGWGYND